MADPDSPSPESPLRNLPPALPVDPARRAYVQRVAKYTCLGILLVYIGLFRLVFATDWLRQSGGVVSLSFILSVPFAFGALSVGLGRWMGSDDWKIHGLRNPLLVLTAGILISVAVKIEAVICVIMGAPLLYLSALAGSLGAHFLLPRNRKAVRLHLSFAVFLPFVAAWVEGSVQLPMETHAIRNTITIHAPAEVVWKEIASVSAIGPEELQSRWIYWAGFPKPIAATLDREGVGGIRTATFERDVSFFETVTEWEPSRRLAFTIEADPEFIPHTAFDQHIIIGGRFYDVLDGIYEIEPISDSSVRLHLTSNHRLSTRFNRYAGWWSDRIMDQIQGSILEVIRKRAEGAGSPRDPTLSRL